MYNIHMNKDIFHHKMKSMKSIREGILKYGICLLVLFLPLVVFPNYFFYYVSSKTILLYGFISVLFPLWLYTIYIDKSYRLSHRQLYFFIPLALYVFWLTISGIWAVNPHLAFWSTFERGTGLITIYFALMSSFVVASVVSRHGYHYLYTLLKFLLIGSFILALSVWFSDRGIDLSYQIFKYSSGGGLTGNSSVSSAYLIFSFFSGIYLLISKTISKKWKIAISIILLTIILSPSFINIYSILINRNLIEFSKGSFVGIFAGLGAMGIGYLCLSRIKKNRNLGIASIFISLIICSIGWGIFITPGTYLHEKFVQVSLESRFIFWDIAQKAMNDHPYLGYGPENYSIAFQDKFDPYLFKSKYYNETSSDKAHNIYFDTGVSGGYPAIAIYLFLFLSIFYAIYEAYKKKKITKLQAGTLWGLFIAYIFQNLFLFDSNISIFYFFVFLGIIYGLLGENLIEHEKEKTESKNIIDKNLKITVSVLLVILSGISLWYFVVLPSRKAILLQNVVSIYFIENKVPLYRNLLNSTSMGNDRDVSAVSDIIFRNYSYGIMHSIYKESDMLPLKNDVKSFFDYLEKISKSNKTDFRLQIALLRFNSIYQFMSGKEASNNSFKIIEEAHRQSPANLEVYWWEAQIYYWHDNIDMAVISYKKAIDLNPNFSTSHDMLIKFAKDTNNKKLYDEALIQAQKDIPGYNFE